MIRRSSHRHFTGLGDHFGVYTALDARLDSAPTPSREVVPVRPRRPRPGGLRDRLADPLRHVRPPE